MHTTEPGYRQQSRTLSKWASLGIVALVIVAAQGAYSSWQRASFPKAVALTIDEHSFVIPTDYLYRRRLPPSNAVDSIKIAMLWPEMTPITGAPVSEGHIDVILETPGTMLQQNIEDRLASGEWEITDEANGLTTVTARPDYGSDIRLLRVADNLTAVIYCFRAEGSRTNPQCYTMFCPYENLNIMIFFDKDNLDQVATMIEKVKGLLNSFAVKHHGLNGAGNASQY